VGSEQLNGERNERKGSNVKHGELSPSAGLPLSGPHLPAHLGPLLVFILPRHHFWPANNCSDAAFMSLLHNP
jgi:hypothetical protein